MKQCPECDENLADDAVHCGHCGAKVEEEAGGGGEKKTMFGLGTISDSELEQAAGQGDEAEDDGGSGSSRLPKPGETGAGDDEPATEQTASAPETDDKSTRLGLATSGDEDDDSAALAKTAAMPSVEDQDEQNGESREADSELEQGRLSNPGSGDEGAVEAATEPDGEASIRDDDGSAFAGVGTPANSGTGTDRNTQGDGRPMPDGPADEPSAGADTTPDSSVRGPEAETAPTDQRPGAAADADDSGGQARRASAPAEADTAPPEDQDASGLAADDRFGDDELQPSGGTPARAGQSSEEGIDKKTLFIVVGILAASGFMCGASGLLVYFFLT